MFPKDKFSFLRPAAFFPYSLEPWRYNVDSKVKHAFRLPFDICLLRNNNRFHREDLHIGNFLVLDHKSFAFRNYNSYKNRQDFVHDQVHRNRIHCNIFHLFRIYS